MIYLWYEFSCGRVASGSLSFIAFEVRPKVCQNHNPSLFCPRALSGLAALVFWCLHNSGVCRHQIVSVYNNKYTRSLFKILVSPTNAVTKYHYYILLVVIFHQILIEQSEPYPWPASQGTRWLLHKLRQVGASNHAPIWELWAVDIRGPLVCISLAWKRESSTTEELHWLNRHGIHFLPLIKTCLCSWFDRPSLPSWTIWKSIGCCMPRFCNVKCG